MIPLTNYARHKEKKKFQNGGNYGLQWRKNLEEWGENPKF